MSVPDVAYRVEIAFNAGYRTPAVDRVWEDVSEWVELAEGMTITYGRSDEFSIADANQLSLVFDNKDGRFTWGNPDSDYYPNVKLGRPIRLTALIGALESVRFTGYINELPVEWPGGTASYATTSVTASSRISRLGLSTASSSAIRNAIEGAGPVAYWPLDDAEEASSAANVIQGSPWPALTRYNQGFTGLGIDDGTVTFGAGVGPSGDENEKAASFDGGRLRGISAVPIPYSTDDFAFEYWVNDVSDELHYSLTLLTNAAGSKYIAHGAGHGANDAGIDAFNGSYTSPLATPAFGPALPPRHVCVTVIAGTASYYVDGELVDTSGVMPAFNLSVIELGGPRALDNGFKGSISHVALYTGDAATAMDAAAVAYHALAGLRMAGQTVDARAQYVAAWAGIEAAEIITPSSTLTLAGTDTEGASWVDLLREVETAEAGVLHDDREGRLVLRGRAARYAVPVALEVDFAAQHAGTDFSPRVDRTGLVNIGNGTNTLGVAVTYTDEASRFEYGDAGYPVETSALDPDEPLYLIAAAVNANSEPRPRAPSVSLDVLADWIASPSLPDLLDLDIGSKVSLLNRPAQAPPAADAYYVDQFVEGYTETFNVGSWAMALNLSSAWPQESVFILDDPVFGVLDAGNVLGL